MILIATAARPRGSHPPISWEDNLYTGIASLINRVVPGWQWNIDTFGKRSLYRYLIQQHTPQAYEYLPLKPCQPIYKPQPLPHERLTLLCNPDIIGFLT
jgi:proline iminopeptidase